MSSRKIDQVPCTSPRRHAGPYFALGSRGCRRASARRVRADQHDDPSANEVVVFKLETAAAPALSLMNTLPTEGKAARGAEFCSSRAISERSELWLE